MRRAIAARAFRTTTLLIVATLCATTDAATIYVDDDGQADFDTIQAAINAATAGDTVSVASGTYYENITMRDGVDLIGAGADVTIIDASGFGDVVDASVDNAAISGFTLINSGQSDWGHINCGVYVIGPRAPIVSNNVIAGSKTGIGLWDGACPDIRNNTITNNSTGIYVYGTEAEPSNPSIVNNTIVNNAHSGITLRVMVSPAIVNNIIASNAVGINSNYVVGAPGLSYNNLWQNGVNYVRDESADDAMAGPGSTSVDPLFARSGYWADVNDLGVIVEPEDPNVVWIEGDYHLQSRAGRYDPHAQLWVTDDVTSPCIDAGDPNSPIGDEPEPNGNLINMGAYGGTAEASKSLSDEVEVIDIQWIGHASVKIWTADVVVYVDPRSVSGSPADATAVLVTHSHGDHYSLADIARASNNDTIFIAPPDVVQQYGRGQTIASEQTIQLNGFNVTGVAAYNTNKPNHPKSNNWVGFIIALGGRRIYVAGDTDLTDEVKAVEDIDVAFLPASGTYVMNAAEAAEATQYILPQLAIPYHWGAFIGTLSDAQRFADRAACPVKIMSAGEVINSEDWLE